MSIFRTYLLNESIVIDALRDVRVPTSVRDILPHEAQSSVVYSVRSRKILEEKLGDQT